MIDRCNVCVMPNPYDEHVSEAQSLIHETNELLNNPEAGGPEQAQTKATLAVAEALLAAGEQLRRGRVALERLPRK
jgi:hypothetical protein